MKSKKMYSRLCVRPMSYIVVFAMLLGSMFVTISTVMADSEPNDSFQTAEEITVGTYEGHLGETDTQDYYKIQLGSGSIVTITFSADSEWDQGLNFYNPIHVHIFDLSSSGTSEVADTYYFANETAADYWYIEIGSFSGTNSAGDYTFTVSVQNQDDAGTDNDVAEAFKNAFEISTGSEITGHLEDLDDKDMYKVHLASGSIVTITFSADSEWDQGLNFYNPIHVHIFDLSSSGTSEVDDTYSIPTDIASGYWYIEIGSFSGANSDGDYTFEASIEGGDGGDGDTNGDDTNGDDTSGNGDDTGGGTPGFEAITVLAAVGIALVIWRRKK